MADNSIGEKGERRLYAKGVALGDSLKSDSADLTNAALGISFAVDGAIKITDMLGNAVVIPTASLNTKTIHPIPIARLWSTGTTATGIILYY